MALEELRAEKEALEFQLHTLKETAFPLLKFFFFFLRALGKAFPGFCFSGDVLCLAFLEGLRASFF